jgi:hypothetical protein
VPFYQYNQRDLLQVTAQLAAADDWAEKVAMAAQRFASLHLHRQARLCYYKELFTEMSRLFRCVCGGGGGTGEQSVCACCHCVIVTWISLCHGIWMPPSTASTSLWGRVWVKGVGQNMSVHMLWRWGLQLPGCVAPVVLIV